MSRILEGLEGVECNIDYVLAHERTQEEHNQKLEAMLKRLSSAGVTLNIDKCQFSVCRIKFLGNIISPERIEADPHKISAINEHACTPQRSRSQVLSWNG